MGVSGCAAHDSLRVAAEELRPVIVARLARRGNEGMSVRLRHCVANVPRFLIRKVAATFWPGGMAQAPETALRRHSVSFLRTSDGIPHQEVLHDCK